MAQNSNVFNITLDQYASFYMTLQVTDSASVPVPIQSWSFTGSIKQQFTAVSPVTTFSIEILDYSQSLVMFALSPYETGLLKRPTYVYDIIATNILPDGKEQVYRVLEGTVTPTPGVT